MTTSSNKNMIVKVNPCSMLSTAHGPCLCNIW